MVSWNLKWIICLILLIVSFEKLSALVGSDMSLADISAVIDDSQAFENRPLDGTITITHSAKEPVDVTSFRLNNAPLAVDLIKEVQVSPGSPLQVAIFHFQIPGQPSGLYMLPSISVKIGGREYQTIPSSYQVSGPAPVLEQDPSSKAVLEIKQFTDLPTPFFPGQRGRIGYRFFFRGNIELVKEDLPLLDAEGFSKIGGKQFNDFEQNGLNVQEVSQTIEANNPGKFNFPGAHLNGYAYGVDVYQKKRYYQPMLKAETPALAVEVSPFPEAGKPPSFQGAVGEFSFASSLLSPSKAMLEDRMLLALDITGASHLNTVTTPYLNLPTLRGPFRLSDLPPTAEIKGDTKRFVVELYPLSTSLQEIPALEFSYFDPKTGQYVTKYSQPIPITITPRPTMPSNIVAPPEPQPTIIKPEVKNVDVPNQTEQLPKVMPPAPLEIVSIESMKISDLHHLPFGSWKSLYIIPFGIIILLLQIALRHYLEEKKKNIHPKSSGDIWKEAMQQPMQSAEFFRLLNQAFLTRLIERGELSSIDIAPEDLPLTGDAGKVRALLYGIEERRFTGKEETLSKDSIDQAQVLFEELAPENKKETHDAAY